MQDITERTFKFSLRIIKLFKFLNEQYSADKYILAGKTHRAAERVRRVKKDFGFNNHIVEKMTFFNFEFLILHL